MRKMLLLTALAAFCVSCSVPKFFGYSQEPVPPPEVEEVKSITELWEPEYYPDFEFEPFQTQQNLVGYTVGIIEMDLNCKVVPPQERVSTPLEQQHQADFVNAFSEGIGNILGSKGMAVRGPFGSYDEMSFVERSKCDFLVQTKCFLELEPTQSTLIEKIPEYGGPHGEPHIYGRSQGNLRANARLVYIVIDPQTRKELAGYTLKSETAIADYEQLWSQWTMTYGKKNVRTGWHTLEYNRSKYPNYHNAANAMGKVFEELYHVFMPKIGKLISVEEFKLLENRK